MSELTEDAIPEWSKAKLKDYQVLNASKPWGEIERRISYGIQYAAWGPFVVEGISAIGDPLISAGLIFGDPIGSNNQDRLLTFGISPLRSYPVKGRVMPREEGDGITWTTTQPNEHQLVIRAIRVGDGPLAALPESASVKQIVDWVMSLEGQS